MNVGVLAFRLSQFHLDAAHGLNDVRHAGKVHGRIVTDVEIKILVDGLDGKLGAAEGIGGVDLARTAPLDRHQRVAHDGRHLDLLVNRVDAEDHDGVGVGTRRVQIARVNAEKRDVDDIVRQGAVLDAEIRIGQGIKG